MDSCSWLSCTRVAFLVQLTMIFEVKHLIMKYLPIHLFAISDTLALGNGIFWHILFTGEKLKLVQNHETSLPWELHSYPEQFFTAKTFYTIRGRMHKNCNPVLLKCRDIVFCLPSQLTFLPHADPDIFWKILFDDCKRGLPHFVQTHCKQQSSQLIFAKMQQN